MLSRPLVRSALVPVLLFACSPNEGDDLAVRDEADADTDADSDADSDADTDADTEPPIGPAGIIDASASLNAEHPTVVDVVWEQSAAATVHLEYSFDTDVWLSSPERELEAGAHGELLLGVPYETEVVWRIVAENDGGLGSTEDAVITTGPLPNDLPESVLREEDPATWDPDVSYVYVSVSTEGSFIGRFWTMIVDRAGRVVWAYESPFERASMHPRITWDKTSFLIDHNSYWGNFDGGINSTVVELKIDGSVVKTWDTPGLHHPFTDLPNGSLAYGRIYSQDLEALTVVYPNGATDDLFQCDEFLDQIGESYDCASNTLWYDEVADRFLFSFWTFETVIEIDGGSGDATRWFGHANGSFDFGPPSSTFYYQHGGHYLPNGNFLTSSQRSDNDHAIVAREYEVDDANERLNEVWSVGLGDDIVGDDMGEVHRLANGNSLLNYGTGGRLRELTPDGVPVWDIDFEGHTVGRSTPITGDLYAFAPERP